jgi:hypothetical protein
VPRNTSSRPGISDTVPEMRADPMTAIPVVRRRGRPMEGRDDPATTESGGASIAPIGAVSRFGGASGRSEPVTAVPVAPAATPRGAHPTDVHSGQRRAEQPQEAVAVPRRGRSAAEVEARTPDRTVREREEASEADREVLRPMFRPLGRQRGEGRDAGQPRDDGQTSDGGWARRRGEDGGRSTGAEGRRGGDGEVRRGGVEARPMGASPREASPREATPRQAAPPPRSEPQAQPRREAPPPPPAAAARHPRRERDQ